MNVKPIRTKRDHAVAVRRIEELMGSGTRAQLDELDVLATLVDAYESRRFPMPAADPIEAIKFRMEQLGLRQTDLAPLMGGRSRVSEILAGRRNLTVAMIRGLARELDIPTDSLLGTGR